MTSGAQGLLLDADVLAAIRHASPNMALVAFLRRRAHRTLFVSVLSVGELKGLYPHPETDRWLEELGERFHDHLLGVDAAVALAWAGRSTPESIIRVGQAANGSWTGAAVEGLIAATAEVHDLTVVSSKAELYREWGVPALDPWTEA